MKFYNQFSGITYYKSDYNYIESIDQFGVEKFAVLNKLINVYDKYLHLFKCFVKGFPEVS